MSNPIGDLMERNLREVFGGRDSDRRKVAISELYTEDCTFFEAEEQIVGRDAINEKVEPKVLAGIVNVISPTVNDEIHTPMGGVHDSGWGRTGPRSLDDFSDLIGSILTPVSASIHSDRKASDRRNHNSSW